MLHIFAGAFPEHGWNQSSEKTIGAVSMKVPIYINRMTEQEKAELIEKSFNTRVHNRLTKFFQTYWIDFGGHHRIDSPWFAGVSARATNPTGEPHQIYANQGRTVYFWLIWCFMVLLHGQLSEYEDAKTMVQNKIQRSHREKSLLHSMPNDGKGIQKEEVKRMFQ